QRTGQAVAAAGAPDQAAAAPGSRAHGGSELGQVTSGNYSPVLERGIGLALLDPAAEPGRAVTVDIRGRPAPATVVKPPFLDRG
ncbi:MAG: glycine cleavage T C-terminal barrel domain-containing protein, partial [Acidimicrobiales bacterium]